MVNKDILKAVGFVSAGLAAGSTCTYLAVNGALKKKYQAIADEEVESVKSAYRLLRKEPPYGDPATAVQAYVDRVQELGYAANAAIDEAEREAEEHVEEAKEELKEARETLNDVEETRNEPVEVLDFSPKQEETINNIFDRARELRKNGAAPQHISHDDYFDDSNEFDKLTITYYEGDETLTDERDSIISDVQETIGRENLERFGDASDNKDVVYVRNERLQTDFEVVRDPRDYTEVVLGFRNTDNGSDRRIRRMRDDE